MQMKNEEVRGENRGKNGGKVDQKIKIGRG